ncbi:Fc.00g081980.m01.CDS01 [Cosmosporella sp. VM-42]
MEDDEPITVAESGAVSDRTREAMKHPSQARKPRARQARSASAKSSKAWLNKKWGGNEWLPPAWRLPKPKKDVEGNSILLEQFKKLTKALELQAVPLDSAVHSKLKALKQITSRMVSMQPLIDALKEIASEELYTEIRMELDDTITTVNTKCPINQQGNSERLQHHENKAEARSEPTSGEGVNPVFIDLSATDEGQDLGGSPKSSYAHEEPKMSTPPETESRAIYQPRSSPFSSRTKKSSADLARGSNDAGQLHKDRSVLEMIGRVDLGGLDLQIEMQNQRYLSASYSFEEKRDELLAIIDRQQQIQKEMKEKASQLASLLEETKVAISAIENLIRTRQLKERIDGIDLSMIGQLLESENGGSPRSGG